MIRKTGSKTSPSSEGGRWQLQSAKAHFSELIRRARTDGPQLVTLHGREEAVVLSAEEYRRLKGSRSGASLVAALQASPWREDEIVPAGSPMPVRDVEL